jgi:addiction module HigA family antidote
MFVLAARLPPDHQQWRIYSAGAMEALTMSKSAITTELLRNPAPGDVLSEDFLKPLDMSQSALAREIGVPPRRINEIVLGKRSITADTDLRLSRYWGVSEGFWLALQADYDLMQRKRQIGGALEQINPRAA